MILLAKNAVTIPALIARHAEDAAFYWSRYFEGPLSSLHNLSSLNRFAFLLDANLEGLKVAQQESGKIDRNGVVTKQGQAGWDATWTRLQKWKTADEAFVSGVLALEASQERSADNNALLTQLQDAAQTQFDDNAQTDIAHGMASAAAWLPIDAVQPVLHNWAKAEHPVPRYCAITACALHRIGDVDAMRLWITDPHPLVRARALRAAGELGLTELAIPLLKHLRAEQEPDVSCRTWAAWSLCLLGQAQAAGPLAQWAGKQPVSQRTDQAWAALAPLLPPKRLEEMIGAALKQPQYQRQALAAIRYSGEVRWIDALIELIDTHTQPKALQAWFTYPAGNLARLAADVLAHITATPLSGSDRGPGLWMPAPEETDDEDDMDINPAIPLARKRDPDEGLLWPDPVKVKTWWQQHRDKFTSTPHWLAGQPLTPEAAQSTLADHDATQLQRQQAAIYLRQHNLTPVLFDVRASIARQQAALAQLAVRPATD
jgi:uncharacterized protein (TIGR02270 family)